MKNFVLVICIVLLNTSFNKNNFLLAQNDSISYKIKIDSLNAMIDSLNQELEGVSKTIDKPKYSDSLLTMNTSETDTSLIPEDQRSRRKQLDELLQYVSQRPGQFFFNGQTNAIIQGNVQKDDRFSTGTGSINLFASSSFGDNVLLFIDLEAIGGNGPDEFSSTLTSLNGDAGSTQSEDGFDRIIVNEAWVEFLFIDDIFTVTAGKIDLTNYFDNNAVANDENSQFITGIFIDNPTFVVPPNSPGLRIRTTILKRFYIQYAISKAENTGNNIFTDLFQVAGFGFKLFPLSDFEANFHIYGYSDPYADNSLGFGVSIDQSIANRFTIFGRIGNNENTLADWYGIKSSWSAGFQFKESFFTEPTIIGIGYGQIKSTEVTIKNEDSFELYLRQNINTWISISTHFQNIWNTGVVNSKYSLIGLRVNFTF
jgi:hypothetical protein